MLLKLCRDGLLYALVLYLFTGMRMDFDVSHWPAGLRWMLVGIWLLVMWCIAGIYRERAKRDRARQA
ncbi:hypothetical protein [Pseudomonas sp. FP1740]|uniref:hypothetical protein n=1 Tax=Pseudomonas sp. FP1740 TaxID=2954078 RepID=UPI002736F31F|nr:hypothetical protein [Pseudomonas sp. FP1740]WLG46740.1 hypothetical protein PSH69_09030 [Pseudomonas sp. FP1740]